MCGIAGYISLQPYDPNSFIKDSVDSLSHRGPDEHGYFSDEKTCLLNTRLSIIDIEGGSQPFYSENKSIAVIQNGEIYNYLEIKNDLINLGVNFKTQSDTEVILKAYEIHGEKCFKLFNGMFSIAILDKNENELVLCRDRLGVKPLYLYYEESRIFFSSEIKTFLRIPSFKKSIDYQSIHNYLKFNYIPMPDTIFASVKHIEPGTYKKFSTLSLESKTFKYWDIHNIKEEKKEESEIIERLDEVLNDAIRIRLRSDVEIGAFLSGGLDSSLVCTITKKNFGIPLNTFTIGFPEKRFDESEWAKRVATFNKIPNNLTKLDADIISLWSETTWFNDQPHGDISFIPTFYLSKFASSEYKVVFTGDGGDEACAGYTKYFSIFNNDMKDYFDEISLIKDDEEFNQLYSDEFIEKINFEIPYQIFSESIECVSDKDMINKILYFDMKHLLPGNNLVKPDKMAMANSLETRSPMLDYRFFEFMLSIPGQDKLKKGQTKYILKKYAERYLPNEIIHREKQMFTVPVGEWFKTKLKDYLEEIIFSESLKKRNIFKENYLEKMVGDHLSGFKDRTRELRAIVNLEIWFRRFID